MSENEREKLLYGIERPSDLRKLPRESVEQVAQEIREEILARVSQTPRRTRFRNEGENSSTLFRNCGADRRTVSSTIPASPRRRRVA